MQRSLSPSVETNWFHANPHKRPSLDVPLCGQWMGNVMPRVVKNSISIKDGLPNQRIVGGASLFWVSKRYFDILISLLLIAILLPAIIVLLVLNPIWNPGRLFFVQTRMGYRCRAFNVYKFRTMTFATQINRGHDDPIEQDRITPLGRVLRNLRIDELPQIINVLRGEMSLIGPRPDDFRHARRYCRVVPNYRSRHQIKPGISGLAQIKLGYAEGVDATLAKVHADLDYINRAGFTLDAVLFIETIKSVMKREGL